MADVQAEYELRRGTPCDIQGHLQFMHDTVLGCHCPVVIELGIQAGNSTSALLSAAQRRGGTLWSCDLQTRSQLAAGLSGGQRRVPDSWWGLPAWKTLTGCSDLSGEALAWMPGQCDVLFVDTDHSMEHTVAVMEAYMPRVKPGGLALFHDTRWVPGDTDLPCPGGPVAAGIAQYCAQHGLAWADRPGSYGMGVVRVP